MDFKNTMELEDIIFKYIDEFKVLFFPDQWSEIFINHSKSEILVLLYLYRYKEANMTQLSDYIIAPLNTTTGVIGRLEKNKLVERLRSNEDRRIVYIKLTAKAVDVLEKEKALIISYVSRIYGSLTKEEKDAAFSILAKVTGILRQEEPPKTPEEIGVKRIKKIVIE